MNKFVFAALSLLILGVTGCKKIEIENGEIPSEYLDEAKPYMGDYYGQFDGFSGRLNLSLDGQKLILSYIGSNGQTDILDSRCESEIGNLETLHVKEKGGQYDITAASFAFSPNFCAFNVAGDELVIRVKRKSDNIILYARIFKEWESRRECRWEGGGHRRRYICRNEHVPMYLEGKFRRVQR